ncbi:unnamed protein product [Cylindrotheca closterium]|uniref:PDZ domain-containing protein n=1 Tax=Cylindrotheca closterium TaxID=2856 RepID=A0AAD2CHM4_9STRA|nr:unnamed protein product [Cylindrotheca closterium]
MDRLTDLPHIANSGYHVPPEVLGVPDQEEPESADSESRPQSYFADVNASARRRTNRAIRGTKSKAAIAAAIRAASQKMAALDYSIFALMTYKSMEVIFASTSSGSIVGVCSRTHLVFQTLSPASGSQVVSISGNSESGMLVVAHENGLIQTYRPLPNESHGFGSGARNEIPCSTFGRYRWVDECTIDGGKVFYHQGEEVRFADRRGAQPGQLLDISTSNINRLLIAHRKQLALFEVMPILESAKDSESAESSGCATLLWTAVLPSNVVTAKISGDADAIVAVLDVPNEHGKVGALTFIRDKDDGSQQKPIDQAKLRRSSSLGLIYKQGPFLEHSAPVSRISFRGLGRETSTELDSSRQQGNDLLLTYCKEDSSNRIFNQNSWQQLMFWSAPPNSRADWIRGTSAFSLGDLESQKKIKNKRLHSRRSSESSVADSSVTGAAAGLKNSGSLGLGAPTTSAGAWIAELTFRSAFPALRLSRLSYMKRGNDDSQPAHFESVAAVLPAGSIVADSILQSDDMGLLIQGVWPAWNPCLSESTGHVSDDTLTGSAMEFLGLSSIPPPTNAFGDSRLGGSLTPPTELRLVATHPETGNIVVMEFPLWGDEEFGAMELGSPIRNVLALSYATTPHSIEAGRQHLSWVSIEYESSRLSARVETDSNRISFLWRKHGSLSLYSPDWREDEDIAPAMGRASPTPTAELLHDTSVMPAPLLLPSLYLPINVTRKDPNKIVALMWLPDSNVGGPPLLLALTTSATLLVFEIAPPWCVTEPTMPNYDPFNSTLHGDSTNYRETNQFASNEDEERDLEHRSEEYAVNVTPHPDFGLGLRLESPMDGTPAVAGSFKKHPLNGGMLPAEKTNMIVLGDELVSVNGVSLENMTFDDIISTVRHVGAKSGPGEALALRFRPAPLGRSKGNSVALQESFNAQAMDFGMQRPTKEKQSQSRHPNDHENEASESLGNLLLDDSLEDQQEFGRLVGVAIDAIPSFSETSISERFTLVPWEKKWFPRNQSSPGDAALVLLAEGRKLFARKLQVSRESGQVDAIVVDLGSFEVLINEKCHGSLVSIRFIENFGNSLSFLLLDADGVARIVVLLFRSDCSANPDFKVFNAFSLQDRAVVRPASMSLFASFQHHTKKPSQTITVWSARPDPSCRELISEVAVRDEYYGKDYIPTRIDVESSHWNSSIRDIAFLKTGYLDHFPTLVVFMESEAIVYQRRGQNLKWHPRIRLTYPAVPDSGLKAFRVRNTELPENCVPSNAFPNILQTLHSALRSNDETTAYVSDWHPESLLAYLFTDWRGANVAWRAHVRKLLVWLSDGTVGTAGDRLQTAMSPVGVPPFQASGGESLFDNNPNQSNDNRRKEDTASLIVSLAGARVTDKEPEDEKLEKLQVILQEWKGSQRNVAVMGKSREFREAMLQEKSNAEDDLFPQALEALRTNEVRALWTIIDVALKLPNYRLIDPEGQMAMTVISLHASMKMNPIKDPKSQAVNKEGGNKKMSSFYEKKSSLDPNKNETAMPPRIAAAGCLSALLSHYQDHLVASIRQPGMKLDWSIAREARLAFWLRSDKALREISEEIGQNLYRESRDILKSALFFILAGKRRTLRNLAAADNTDSGRKFYKFLSDYDFSSPRGRSAAEKNAFSLLRKNRYECAAAFFLLPDPPILKSAVEIIATKMRDLDLAFMVARLLGNAKESITGTVGLSGATSGYSSAIAIGGGGGYAGSGFVDSSDCKKDETSFSDWGPELSQVAKDLLIDRGLPQAYNDSCFSAVQLMWLGRNDEASHWLSGFIRSQDGLLPCFARDICITRLDEMDSRRGFNDSLLAMNGFIDFISGPLLLKMMQSSKRTRLASTLLVTTSLSRLGIELPCLRLILQSFDHTAFREEDGKLSMSNKGAEYDKRDVQHESETVPPASTKHMNGIQRQTGTSIFDSFSTAPTKELQTSVNDSQMQSSIFNSFEAAPAKKTLPSTSDGQMQSSIFDSFEAAPAKKTLPSTSDGQMQSSIFDSFEAAPAKKTLPSTSDGQMQSSIFDSFEAAPAKKTLPSTSDGQMQSSIFDSFEAAPAKRTLPSISDGQMQSSIFDSFEAAPAKKTLPSTSDGQMQSSIFDSFEAAPAKKTLPSTNTPTQQTLTKASQLQSSISDASTADSNGPDRPEGRKQKIFRQPPMLWLEWGQKFLLDISARRLIRDVITIGTRFGGDIFHPRLTPTSRDSFVPTNASRMLQLHCDGASLLQEIVDCVQHVSNMCKLGNDVVVNRAVQLLWSPNHFYRCCFVVLLNLAVQQLDFAEDVVRITSVTLIQHCGTVSLLNDGLTQNRKSISHSTTLCLRRHVTNLSWQLELCLWLHRGGALPLSGIVLNEAICAIRLGLVIASWNQDFECLEALLEQPPDCLVDDDAGRQLWSSLKIITSSSLGERRQSGFGTPSGGWEFLVDCTRQDATDLLRSRETGCFIIRPHPDDHGVFTLSFKTNLVPDNQNKTERATIRTDISTPTSTQTKSPSKSVRRDDVVQHAIVRLSDSGFRCGSFGPFATLMKLLEAVSASLPFDLRFDQPPNQGLIREEGSKPSPNCALYRKLGLLQAKRISTVHHTDDSFLVTEPKVIISNNMDIPELSGQENNRLKRFGMFLELLLVSALRKQLGGVAAARYDKTNLALDDDYVEIESVGSNSGTSGGIGAEQEYACSARVLRPLLSWCRVLEIAVVRGIEVSTNKTADMLVTGDSAIKKMIQPGSGVDFRTLRLGDGGDSALVVLFEKQEAVNWFLSVGREKTKEDALRRLQNMEASRVIEAINLHLLLPKGRPQPAAEGGDQDGEVGSEEAGIHYRLIDPWEVEPLYSREDETRSASLGRNRFLTFSLRKIQESFENMFRSTGGVNLLELWARAKGNIALTKTIATVQPPWERAAGGDLQLHDGMVSEPDPYENSIRVHLYRNALYRQLKLPQRFIALIQVELLDLKNLTSPGGSLTLTVYSLLRVKRSRSSSPLTNKARTLDSIATSPVKLGKSTGPNAPASWGSVVRFRFPLPEDTNIEGRSFDADRESLFRGPPTVLQLSVYEKKFMSDALLGSADVKLDGLSSGGQLEEWLPLRMGNDGINWFARIRLTLRFELMCLSKDANDDGEFAESACIRRIYQLGNNGGATAKMKNSSSTPDLLSYLESIVY